MNPKVAPFSEHPIQCDFTRAQGLGLGMAVVGAVHGAYLGAPALGGHPGFLLMGAGVSIAGALKLRRARRKQDVVVRGISAPDQERALAWVRRAPVFSLFGDQNAVAARLRTAFHDARWMRDFVASGALDQLLQKKSLLKAIGVEELLEAVTDDVCKVVVEFHAQRHFCARAIQAQCEGNAQQYAKALTAPVTPNSGREVARQIQGWLDRAPGDRFVSGSIAAALHRAVHHLPRNDPKRGAVIANIVTRQNPQDTWPQGVCQTHHDVVRGFWAGMGGNAPRLELRVSPQSAWRDDYAARQPDRLDRDDLVEFLVGPPSRDTGEVPRVVNRFVTQGWDPFDLGQLLASVADYLPDDPRRGAILAMMTE